MNSAISTNGRHTPITSTAALLDQGIPPGLLGEDLSKDSERSLAIIDSRALDRECFARGIAAHTRGLKVLAVGTIEEWRRVKDQYPPLSAILLHVGGRNIGDETVEDEIRKLVAAFKSVPIIVLADTDDLSQILKALECGARGYIPSTVGIRVCVELIELALAGGTFVPASSVMAVRQVLESSRETARPLAGLFTMRQAEVVEALRRGKANKIIAYELNLRESTVKVHIRNIMKKLKATNRTEVAYKIKDLLPAEGQHTAARMPTWSGEPISI
ncbi:response regulator transcription factor [Mesorhizobium sp. SP-1A]|jgi:DNA-binding NarL/FixJ family response regulator|uniref:response regulator transcription factor n=1 Tax=Mesorhizobium sp. SP-1A TaxID=3077840 RepID=UPI0028F72FF5|nr:response regulator transcription factor [Mesorhizobium sp. SP-1A]